jgi:hypothetical protein
MRFSSITVSIIGAAMLIVAGCQKVDSISGSVTYNGEPVQKGAITFASADGSGPGFGAMVEDGKYTTDRARRGAHVAQVRGVTDRPVLSKEEFLNRADRHHVRYDLPTDYIPEDAEGNNQTVDIQGGSQAFDIAIKGPPRPDKPPAK